MKKRISKMKSGKAAGPSGIVVEMLKASGTGTLYGTDTGTGIDLVTELTNSVVNGVVPADWKVSSTVNTYKGKGDDLERSNYRSL